MSKVTAIDPAATRQADHDIDELFLRRWSPRAMSGEALTRDELNSLFEAARWAPSSYNAQPWRILYARRDTADWDRFYGLLGKGNRTWAGGAAVLLVFLSRRRFERNGEPAPTHSFDAGAAWENLALQASIMGLVAHGMQGFDYDRAREALHVPEAYAVEAMIAVGRPGDRADLDERLREKETPSSRKTVEEFAFEGSFPRT